MAGRRRLKIAHVVRSDVFAGVERSVCLAACCLHDRGHEVSVIGGEVSTVRHHLGDRSIDIHPATTTIEAARALRRVGPVDVVHAHMTAAEAASLITWPAHRGRLVFTRHFASRRGVGSRPGRALAFAVGLVPHTEVAISQYVADRIGVPSTVVHHGMETSAAVDCTGRIVVMIQRLQSEKRTDDALRAWALSGLGDEGWELLIAGDGDEREALNALVRDLGQSDSVQFLGRVTDTAALRRIAAFQLAPTAVEGFGLTVLEAMACGLPVVAADGGAHRELIGDLDALLFSPGDESAMARRMRALASSDTDRRNLGARLLQRQQELFSLDAHADKLEQLYLEVLGR